MALISCPECKSEVSSTAHKCMKCGHVINKPKRGFFGKTFKWSFIAFNALMLVWLIGGVNAAAHSSVQAATEAG